MLLHADPSRVRPIDLSPPLARMLFSHRLRAFALPADSATQRLRPGDVLWAREGFRAADKPHPKGRLVLRYAGFSDPVEVPWPDRHARPLTARPPNAMPQRVSRFTLVIESVGMKLLSEMTEDEALACGAVPSGEGYCGPTDLIEHAVPYVSAAEAHAAYFHSRYHMSEVADPEVVVLGFKAYARNVLDLVPALGKGGVR